MRGVPMILWITIIGFGIPGLIQNRTWGKAIVWAALALVLAYSAYVSEVFRSGIEGVPESQRAAARSLGLTHGQTLRLVVVPQAIRRVVPPLMNDLVSLQKDVALVSLIGPIEILRQAGIDKSKFANFTPYVAAAVVFLIVTVHGVQAGTDRKNLFFIIVAAGGASVVLFASSARALQARHKHLTRAEKDAILAEATR